MKLNVTFVPFDGRSKEFKVVCFGDKDSLVEVLRGVQSDNFCTNVYMTEDKKEEN